MYTLTAYYPIVPHEYTLGTTYHVHTYSLLSYFVARIHSCENTHILFTILLCLTYTLIMYPYTVYNPNVPHKNTLVTTKGLESQSDHLNEGGLSKSLATHAVSVQTQKC